MFQILDIIIHVGILIPTAGLIAALIYILLIAYVVDMLICHQYICLNKVSLKVSVVVV